jgi:hypothetical protein
VLDADGARVEADEVQLELCDVNFWPRDFRARRGESWAADGLVRCIAGTYVVRVRHGGASGVTRVEGLAPGETRPVQVQLRAPSRLAGRLVDEFGVPYASVEILAARPAAVGDSAASEVCRARRSCGPAESFRHEIAATRTDAQGNFVFTFEEPETVFLCVVDAFGTRQVGGAVTLGPGEERTELPLVCPRLARVSGVLYGPPSASVQGLRLLLAASSAQVRHKLEFELPASGAFAFEDVPPGSYRLFLLPPEASWVSATGSVYSRASSSLCFYEEGALCNGQRLGSLEVRPGEDPVLELHVAAEDWPGRLVFEVLVDEHPVARWRVRLTDASSSCEVEFGTNDAGCAEMSVFAGDWRLEIEDPLTGWRYSFPERLPVRANEVTRRVLAVERP